VFAQFPGAVREAAQAGRGVFTDEAGVGGLALDFHVEDSWDRAGLSGIVIRAAMNGGAEAMNAPQRAQVASVQTIDHSGS
jgi:hypothetical protein